MYTYSQIRENIKNSKSTSTKSKHPVLLPGMRLISGVHVGEKIGRGHFSTVYHAKLKSNPGPAVVKVYGHGESNDAYYRNEIYILNKLTNVGRDRHPNIVDCRGMFTYWHTTSDMITEIYGCLVFDYAGDNLLDLLESRRKPEGPLGLPMPVVKRIMTQLLGALVYVHDAEIIHGDIKTGNILICCKSNECNLAEVNIKLIDFGSSTPADDLFSETVGTPEYHAPETVLKLPYSYSVDMWAAFVVCYELATSDLMFDIYAETGTDYGDGLGADMDTSSAGTSSGDSQPELVDVDNPDTSTAANKTGGSRSTSESDSDSDVSKDKSESNHYYLTLVSRVLGAPPESIYSKDGGLYYTGGGAIQGRPNLQPIGILGLLEVNRSRYNIDYDSAASLADFLARGIVYEPEKRASAREAFRDPWLST